MPHGPASRLRKPVLAGVRGGHPEATPRYGTRSVLNLRAAYFSQYQLVGMAWFDPWPGLKYVVAGFGLFSVLLRNAWTESATGQAASETFR
jgi:hypothetical protein